MNWTEAQLKAVMKPDEIDEPESVLQSKIVEWAIAKGYPFHSHPKTKAYYRAHTKGAGWPDVTIALKNCILFIECKTKKGPTKESQTTVAIIFMHLKLEYHKVRTWKAFLKIAERLEKGGRNGRPTRSCP